MSPILGCCLDEEGHMLTAQDGELAHRAPAQRKGPSIGLGRTGSHPVLGFREEAQTA